MKNAMQRAILPALIFTCFSFFSTQAQSTANVTLNVVLQNAASIVINGANNVATLTYAAPADYTNGVSLDQAAALTTISNQPYSVTVYASGELTNGTNTIPVGDVTVTPSLASANTDITLTGVAIPVGTASAANIIVSTAGTASQDFNLNYSTEAAPTADFINKPTGTYTTTLTYTLTNP
ncbi:hypothetical protein [Arachidicoccus terrestris]|uniref:hypothetical protein n=1 Tax=Arachidicoccus terrestris TaxID=2875539 RepID=UPI001CC35B4E|nr:hypothetical protein [Arachidicoccus terrestris]UAY55390.1 hypothetical protein K9M52_18615 [Arachidicoccus terrestris]